MKQPARVYARNPGLERPVMVSLLSFIFLYKYFTSFRSVYQIGAYSNIICFVQKENINFQTI